jgi:N-acetylneuraminate lyase
MTGLIPAPHTPFHPDGSLNLDVVALQAELFRECGHETVFAGGSTGEWSSLTLDERRALGERWREVAGDSLQVVLHVGAYCQADAMALARHAREIGATAVSAVAPGYFKPAGIAELVEFWEGVAAAAAPLPFYIYDIPSMTGVSLPMSQVIREAKPRIPNLVGLKFTNGDFVELQECIRLDGGAYGVLLGFDECYLAGLGFGITGSVGNTYNYSTPIYRRIDAAFAKGDFEAARRDQRISVDLVKILQQFGFQAASKAVMGMLGVDCGPVRPPIRNLSRAELVALWERLSPLDAFPRPLRRPE